MTKNYRRAECCFNCERFINYNNESDACKLNNTKIGATSVCDSFIEKVSE